MSLSHFATIVLDAGKYKPEYLFKRTIHFLRIQNTLAEQIFIFRNPEYSFKKDIHFLKSRIFIQKDIHSLKRGRIAYHF